MPATIRVDSVRRIGNRGGFEVLTTDSRGLTESISFENRQTARNELQKLMDDESVKDVLRLILIARGLRSGQDGDTADDFDAMIGRSITINLRAAQNIVRIV